MDKTVRSTPKVTVLMPVYNCELYIKEAIDSILNQTYTDFEFLIIDDASTDNTLNIIKSYTDSRIQLIEKSINSGLTVSLNMGLALAKGKYIARMDGDDSSFPERFAKQVTFLEANTEFVLCGSWFNLMGSDRVIKLPESHDAIKLALLSGNCIAHPSVMMRKQAVDEFPIVYDFSKEPAEDYDLWVRLVTKGRLHNLQEVLLDYRAHANQVSKKLNVLQKKSVFEIKQAYFKNLELELLPEEQVVLDKILNNGANIVFNDIYVFKKLQIKLYASNTKKFFEPVSFKKYVLELELRVVNNYFLKRNKFTPTIYLEYLKIKNKLDFKLSISYEFKLFIKSLIWHTNKS